ncbi:MAG: HAD family phosphatase [Bacteroidales bacterium]|jgi:putative hydrolase of the HAD superfamily|nr:HAD family phosphatase [Bacteroidales bacterium]
MTEAIIFDLGGVLVDLDLKNCIRHFKNILGYGKITDLLDPSHQKGIYSDLEEGLLKPEEFRKLILSDSRPGTTEHDVDVCMWSLLTRMDDYKVPYLEKLSESYDLYILSNNNPISMHRCHEVFTDSGLDYKKVFKEEFISYSMRLLKPGHEIFEEVIRRIGIPSGKLLFIDDSLDNVKAAEAAGIPSLHYSQGADLVSQVDSVLDPPIPGSLAKEESGC